MTREEAIQLLQVGSAHERLKAARFLVRNAEAGDIAVLRRARQAETVSYVKASLDVGLARLSNLVQEISADPYDEFDIPGPVRRKIRSQAVEWVAGLLLHEIASPIGLAKRSASREVTDYENSKTKRHLESVELIFNAIAQLKTAAAVPKPEEFDLSEHLRDIVNAEANEDQISKIALAGPTPMMVISDPSLLSLAIRNGVRNALEAISSSAIIETYPIVITWGYTDINYWVAIVDRGVGLVGSPEGAFDIGVSTKSGHRGFGLAIARQAIETLGGTVSLAPGAHGGARYEAKWDR